MSHGCRRSSLGFGGQLLTARCVRCVSVHVYTQVEMHFSTAALVQLLSTVHLIRTVDVCTKA
jgi:hypothetical protein